MALAAAAPAGAGFVAGGDVRRSTPRFLAALIQGLAAGGVVVDDLGVQPTPVLYFSARSRGAAGVAIVTASHSPPRLNGLKWMIGERPPSEADVQALRRAAEAPEPAPRPGGRVERTDIMPAYRAWLADVWREAASTHLRGVVDPGNGCWSRRAVECLTAAFPRCEWSGIHDREDGDFPERDPDSAKRQNLASLRKAVRDRAADLGIAFDGDGDRVAFVDAEGVPLTAEETTYVLLQGLGDRLAGRAFVYDVKFSDRIAETAQRLGAKALVERSGHAFIRSRMLKTDALFGAEISGHYFHAALRAGDDGLYTACCMVAWLGRCGLTLADLRRACPPVFVTDDLRLALSADEMDQALRTIRAAFSGRPVSSVDGVRVSFPGGWALVRCSVTEAKLTFRFEGDSAERLDQVVEEFCRALPGLGDRIMEQHDRAKRR
jgi:phosphomannomutase